MSEREFNSVQELMEYVEAEAHRRIDEKKSKASR